MTRIRSPQLLVGQAPAIVLAAFRGLDKDIRGGEHLQKNFAALFRGDIERHRAHIAAAELDRPALMEAAASRDVGRFRVLDPDDVGAHVGHELRAKGTSDRNGRMYHLHALERAELGNISSSHNSFSLRLFLHFFKQRLQRPRACSGRRAPPRRACQPSLRLCAEARS